eukprot:TRINITY_DN2953_c1_g1_i2.p3 TRINITY_DN2953_c1_g1~~TRINITY_DN2953_c1_g1_i2.p3  ORF type:complete len:142 (+),score=33.55 TRINITY_DN2953_c1_g1_i2:85-510(+)
MRRVDGAHPALLSQHLYSLQVAGAALVLLACILCRCSGPWSDTGHHIGRAGGALLALSALLSTGDVLLCTVATCLLVAWATAGVGKKNAPAPGRAPPQPAAPAAAAAAAAGARQPDPAAVPRQAADREDVVTLRIRRGSAS